MKKPNVVIHNTKTNEVIVREMTDAEFASHQAEKEIDAAKETETQARATQKAALLERLGITEAEARLLLG